MSWQPDLLLTHPRFPWTLDATQMNLSRPALDALNWDTVFSEMSALEGGAIANGDEQRQVGHYWLRNPKMAPTIGQARAIGETTEAVRDFAQQIRTGALCNDLGERYTDVIHVGIGGSALGPALLVDALSREDALQVHFIDNTDPDGIERTLNRVRSRLRRVLVLVVTKSGGTHETLNGLALVTEAFAQKGLEHGPNMVAITGAGSSLEARATAEGWRRIFHMWDWVGGRFSLLSAVGLLPAELAGISTEPLQKGAADMDEWTRNTDSKNNPAALLAGVWFLAGEGEGKRAMVVLPYADRLLLFARYLQQLIMESIGKAVDRDGATVHQGLTVYGNKGSTDQHAYVQQLRDGPNDFFVHFIQVLGDGAGSATPLGDGANVGDFLQGFLLGTRRALTEESRPSLTITVPAVNAYTLGGLIALFERAVGFYATLINVNAYHQPGVEAGKRAAKQILTLSKALQAEVQARPQSVQSLAKTLGAEPVELFYILERLVKTGRISRTGQAPHQQYTGVTP